jgi:hypothetical protein
MAWGIDFLRAFVQHCYPDAVVQRLAQTNDWRVSFVVSDRDLLAQRNEYLHDIAKKLRPKFTPRRKLYWGRRCCRHRR